MLGYFCFPYWICTVLFASRCRFPDWRAVLSGGVFLEVLSFSYNRMGMFLVSEFVMTVTGVCDSIRLIIG